MVEINCPKCKSSLQAEKFGTYVSCSYCKEEFFNVDPGVVQKPAKDAAFVIRMVFLAIFSLLTVGVLAFCLITSSPMFAGAIFPLAAAIACLWEGGFRMVFAILTGAVVCSIAAFVLGLIGTRDPVNASIIAVFGAAVGIVIGFSLNQLFRRGKWLGARCPFCFHRGIVGAGNDVTCRHCGHTPKVSAEQRAVIDILSNYNCNNAKNGHIVCLIIGLVCWGVLLLMAAWQVEYSALVLVLFFCGLFFFIVAYLAKKRCKCSRCKNLWVMVKISEKSLVDNKLKFEELKKHDNATHQDEEHLHLYYDKTTVATFACKCCGHIRTETTKGKESAGMFKI